MTKKKPTYTTYQNTAHLLKTAWYWDKRIVLIIAAQIFFTVAISTVWIFLPATVVERIINNATAETLIFTVLAFTVAIVVLSALQTWFDSIAQMRRSLFNIYTMFQIRDKVIDTDYVNLEMQEFTDAKSKAQNFMYMTNSIFWHIQGLGTNILGFIVYLILLTAVNPLVVLISAATTLLGMFARIWANRWRHSNDHIEAAYNKRIFNINYNGQQYGIAKDVRLYKMLPWIRRIFWRNIARAYKFTRSVETRHWLADIVAGVGNLILNSIVYIYLIWQVLYENLTVDAFVLMVAAVFGFSGWFVGILGGIAELSEFSLRFCRIREFLNFPDKFKQQDGENITPEDIPYSLTLENVSLQYSGAAETTLDNINLHINAGENVAIVGANGAGKTTLVKLLCGFYDPTSGVVRLNGKDIREYNRKAYYRLFTAVFQNFNILPNTIAENIAQTVENIDFDRVNHCLELAELSEKIATFPDGVNSHMLKEIYLDGVVLSGGETQRLMLARALYKNAPILILDEPTAALDPIAESRLYERYNELASGRTSIYISHRLASTRFCDRIILIDNKQIAEMGTHEELLAKGGKYAELFEIQSKYYRENAESLEDL
ncbi:MAG: ABC transporter ATP-binding protein/permease [Defluviitaleaceae bacterium]|nr:ABC transporter ATP-binding protein/permease [Defluviitaleaceae bacterium]